MNRIPTPITGATELTAIRVEGHSRGAFLLRTALATGGLLGLGAIGPRVQQALAQGADGDVGILNFALTLEYLESEYYAQGLKKVSGLTEEATKLAEKLQEDEAAHVEALVKTIGSLGGTPVKKPTFDFSSAYGSADAFLKTANTLEDTGVSAYNGAAPMIESTEVLDAAGSIVQIEARHAALIRLLRDEPPAPLAFDVTSTQDEVLAAVKPFIKG